MIGQQMSCFEVNSVGYRNFLLRDPDNILMVQKIYSVAAIVDSKVPEGCPQCPEGGYDVISGTRRLLLLDRLQKDIVTYYQNNDFNQFLAVLQQLLKDGLPPSDLDGINLHLVGGELHLECKREKNQNGQETICLRVRHLDNDLSVVIIASDIVPMAIKEINSCPLIDPHDYTACNDNSCNFIQNLKDKMKLINAPSDP